MSSRYFIACCCVLISYGLQLTGCAAPMPEVRQPEVVEPAEATVAPSVEQTTQEVEYFEQDQMESTEQVMQQEGGMQQVQQSVVSPARDAIEQRLRLYEDKLWSWNILENQMAEWGIEDQRPSGWYACLKQLERLVTNYSKVRDIRSGDIQAEDLEAGYWLDIEYLESNCDEVYEIVAAAEVNWTGQFADSQAEQLAANVKHLAENGKDKEALQAYHDLITTFPNYTIQPSLSKSHSLALIRTGQLDKAVSVLQQSLKGLGPQQDNLFMLRLYADLLLATSNVEEAKLQYLRLADVFTEVKDYDRWVADQLALLKNIEGYDNELVSFIAVMQAYVAFDGMHVPSSLRRRVDQLESQYPASIIANRARNILWQVEEQAGTWVGRKLVKVDSLVENKEYQKAVAILEGLLDGQLPPEIKDVVQKTLDDVKLAEVEEQKAKQLLLEQARTMQWDEATRLFEMRQYDTAIAAYTLLLDTDYEDQAKEKIKDAANLAASEMRRTAANLFVKARRTGSQEQRKALMLESWQLLNQIPIKYPDAEILDKVAENIKILEDQIRILEPELLEEIQDVSGQLE